MSEKKPVPLLVKDKGKTCPVCGKKSYSREGIHPQCAVKRADAALDEVIKDERTREAATPNSSSWNKKSCPKCHAVSHVRLKRCQCGHGFF